MQQCGEQGEHSSPSSHSQRKESSFSSPSHSHTTIHHLTQNPNQKKKKNQNLSTERKLNKDNSRVLPGFGNSWSHSWKVCSSSSTSTDERSQGRGPSKASTLGSEEGREMGRTERRSLLPESLERAAATQLSQDSMAAGRWRAVGGDV